jgi:hypothetical protein
MGLCIGEGRARGSWTQGLPRSAASHTLTRRRPVEELLPTRRKKEGTGHWKGGGTPCAASLLLWMEKRRGDEERLRQEKGRSGSTVYYASILEIDRDWESFTWPID